LTVEGLMQISRNFAAAARRHGRKIAVGILCGMALSACAHRVPTLRNDHTAVISGKRTVGNSSREAARIILIQAARLTLDHGFRYFTIVCSPVANSIRSGTPSIQPGADVTIRVYRQGEIDPLSPNVWDAGSIAASDL
jgi:hypothetical protein